MFSDKHTDIQHFREYVAKFHELCDLNNQRPRYSGIIAETVNSISLDIKAQLLRLKVAISEFLSLN